MMNSAEQETRTEGDEERLADSRARIEQLSREHTGYKARVGLLERQLSQQQKPQSTPNLNGNIGPMKKEEMESLSQEAFGGSHNCESSTNKSCLDRLPTESGGYSGYEDFAGATPTFRSVQGDNNSDVSELTLGQ